VYHAFSAAVQQVMSFSFVAVTLYMVAKLVGDPMQLYADGADMPLFRFVLVAAAWRKYVLFALVLKRR
jgi:hypothetical protein